MGSGVMDIDGDILEQILAAINTNGRRIDNLRKKTNEVIRDIRGLQAALELLISSFQSHGTEIENIKQQCNKRAAVCSEAFSRLHAEMTGNGGDR